MANDLVLKPDYVFDEMPQYKTLITQFENGAEQRRAKRSGVVTEYNLVYTNKNITDLTTIKTLFTAKKGALTAFTWTHPISGSTVTVRFKTDSLTYSYIGYGLYNFEFKLTTII